MTMRQLDLIIRQSTGLPDRDALGWNLLLEPGKPGRGLRGMGRSARLRNWLGFRTGGDRGWNTLGRFGKVSAWVRA